MRILHVITTLFTGGAERLMVDLLPRFKAAGHEVELLVFHSADTPFAEKLRKTDIKIHFLNTTRVYSPLNIFRLKKFLNNYDVIHTHNTMLLLLQNFSAAKQNFSPRSITPQTAAVICR